MLRITMLKTIVRYALIVSIIAVIAGLLWWYLFLRGQQETLQATDLGRGAGLETPSFGDAVGSALGNLIADLSPPSSSTTSEELLPQLWQASRAPVAGAAFMLQEAGTTTSLRFVERGTGYVFEAHVKNGVLTRFSNTLIPQVYEAQIGQNGVIMFSTIDERGAVVIQAARATSSPQEGKEISPLSLSALPQGIRSLALSPEGDEILYISETSAGATLSRSSWPGGQVTEIAKIGVLGWSILWPSENEIFLLQHSSDSIPGYAYTLVQGKLLPLISMNALSIAPKPGSDALLYGSGVGTIFARLNENASAISLPVRTSADKCVWAPDSPSVAYCAVPKILPNTSFSARLRGESHAADSWWRIDVNAGRAELLHAMEGVAIDVEKPIIDQEGMFLAFTNAEDKSLWLLRVRNE